MKSITDSGSRKRPFVRTGLLGGASVCLLVLGAAMTGAMPVMAADGPTSAPVAPGEFHGDVRDLPKPAPSPPAEYAPRVTRPPADPDPAANLLEWPRPGDPLLQPAPSLFRLQRTFNPPDLNFPGIPNQGGAPPDTVGEIGANHYVQMTNSSVVQIYDKTGALLAGPFALDSLAPPGDACQAGRGDPIVLYDELADRWLFTEFATGVNRLCVYVSMTDDPIAGGWFFYAFDTPDFPDYPKYGVWPDAYYVATNESSPAVYAMDRVNMLAGNPATMQRFTAPPLAGFGFQALIPADLDGPAPPGGSSGYFMRHRDDEVHNAGSNDPAQDFLEVWAFSVDFVTPANSTFTQIANIPVAEFDSDLCGLVSFFCFPQPGTATTLDPLREVIMWRLQYRNFGTHETLVGNFVTDVSGTDQGGIRWFELRRTPPGAGAWSLFQEGTHSPDADSRWMGSIAMDQDGNIALGYSVSSAATFPSIRYTGRLATDPPGTMPLGEVTAVPGAFSQTNVTRWGDYSSMNVDPVDGCTFWYTNEFVGDGNPNGFGGTGNWTTQIVRFDLGSCANQPPVCDADGPYVAECAADATLDGSGSFDPEGVALDFEWTGPFSPSPSAGMTPTVQFPAPTGLKMVDLEVSDGIATDACTAAVTVVDTTPPVIVCPADATLEAPADTSVAANGSATAVDSCTTATIGHADATVLACTITKEIARTWTATDASGNTDQCLQSVKVVVSTVRFGRYNSGVVNRPLSDGSGCTIADEYAQCEPLVNSRGPYLACIERVNKRLLLNYTIGRAERHTILRAAIRHQADH